MDDGVWPILFQWTVETAELLHTVQSVLGLELENASTNLYAYFPTLFDWHWLLNKDKSTELRHFVSYTENEVPSGSSRLIRHMMNFKRRMMPTNTHISNSHLTLGSTANHDFIAPGKVDHMNCLWRTISDRFDDHMLVTIFMDVKHQ
jgi:hypothetical protein